MARLWLVFLCVSVAALVGCGSGDQLPRPSPTDGTGTVATASPSPVVTATAATPEPTPTASPAVETTATPTPATTEATTPSPTPTHTATEPSQTSAPAATETTAPTPTTTPPEPVEATPTATPEPLPNAEELGFREIDTEEALSAAGLTHVQYEPGEAVPWEAGLYLLDVETAEVEGWIVPEGDAVEETDRGRAAVGTVVVDLTLSQGNRFLLLSGDALHDRATGRTYTWDKSRLSPATAENGDLVGWVTGSEEQLVWSYSSVSFVVVDSTLHAVTRFRLPASGYTRLWPDASGRYIFAQQSEHLYLFDLEQAGPIPLVPAASWSLSWFEWEDRKGNPIGWVEPFDHGIVLINPIDSETCRIVRYSTDSLDPTDHTLRCWQDYRPFFDLSPDGRLIAIATVGRPADYLLAPGVDVISIFDLMSGEETLRVHGAHQPWYDWDITNVWLADSSALIVGTAYGQRIVTIDGRWAIPPPGVPAPDDLDRFATSDPAVKDRRGDVLASLPFGPSSREILGLMATSIEWGASSNTLRVNNGIFYKWFDVLSSSRPPAIERPPFSDRLWVEVAVNTCLNLREDPSVRSAIVTCLPDGTLLEAHLSDRQAKEWLYVHTSDGVKGWARSSYLRWPSNIVPLEE